MAMVGYVGLTSEASPSFLSLMVPYSLAVAFYMPTLALSNSVSYTAMEKVGLEPIKNFPPIRVFGTIGFICSMLLTDVLGFQSTPMQFFLSAGMGAMASCYSLTLPACPTANKSAGKTWRDVLGMNAFALFKERKMAVFFIFSILLGVALQITNGFANPFLQSFEKLPEYADAFGVRHANALISLSQLSETFCLLLIPFALRRFGIKFVMLIAMLCWVLRFGLFGLGNPGDGVWMFILSMLVYGVAFDFFNISGSLFVNKETDLSMRSSAQGLFMMMTNGFGATIGTVLAQQVVNHYVDFASNVPQVEGWSKAWFVFAGYMLVVAVLFAILFKNEKTN
jgi:NHS family xanthosine MFS transporter